MLYDGILEESYSDYVNPLTLVHREHKPLRICVDTRGVIDKFMHVYQGPYIIHKILPHSTYETVDNKGKLRGKFNKRQLKPHRSEDEEKERGHQT
jgi:hypothetical protein